MFADTRPAAIEGMRHAASELRAELAGGGSRSWSTATSTSPRLHRGARLLASGRASARPTPTDTGGIRAPGARGGGPRRRRAVRPVRPPPRLEAGGLPGLAPLPRARPAAAGSTSTCTPTRRWRSRTCRRLGLPPQRSSPAWRRRAGLHPGTAAECCTTACVNTSPQPAPRGPVGGDHRSLPPRRAAFDRDGHVRHIEEPWEPPSNARGRGLQARTGGIRVRAPLLHPLPDAAGACARRGGMARAGPRAHRRLPPRARWQRPERAGLVGEDGAGGGRSLRWGVNDLGCTDGRSISRLAAPTTARAWTPSSWSPPRTRRVARLRSARRCTTSRVAELPVAS